MAPRRPTIALVAGDPAGVGPELIARLLADGSAVQRANIILIGSREALLERDVPTRRSRDSLASGA